MWTGYGDTDPPLPADTDLWSRLDRGDDATTKSMGDTVLGIGVDAEEGECWCWLVGLV